jgi:hypothetical protein
MDRGRVRGPGAASRAIHTRLSIGLGGGRVGFGWASDRSCHLVPEAEQLAVARLDARLGELCAGAGESCVDAARIAFGAQASFRDVANALGSVRRHAAASFRFIFARPPGSPLVGEPAERACGRAIPQSAMGRLPPEEIQRVVRSNFGNFRECYERGLARDRNLAGRVATRFVIGRDGKVESVASEDLAPPPPPPGPAPGDAKWTPIGDPEVVACVLRGFHALTFPKPYGGIVTVVYPLIFNPGD